MPDSPFVALVHNAALLLALVLVYDLVVSRYPLADKTGRQLLIGAVLGGMGVGIMLAPFQLVPGIVFDTRSVLLAVSGLFFGFVPTLVAMLLTAAYRLSQGGAAAWVGVAVIVASGCLGLLWRRRCRQALANVTWRQLYGLGLAVHVVMLLLMLALGWSAGRDVLTAIGLPVLVIYPVATTALGLLLANQLRREQAAAAQQESEQRWQFALEGAGDGVWDWDVVNQRLFFSPKWKRMLGYDEADIGHGLEEWSGRVHPEDLPGALADVQAHLEGRTAAYSNEHRMRCKDGNYKWIHDRGLVVSRDAGGKARRMVGTHADITARREAEAASARQRLDLQTLVRQLEDSRGMLQSIIESIPVRVFWKDKELRYQGCNSLFARDAGFSRPAELQGQDDRAMGWSAQAELYQKDDREVMATGRPKLNILEPQNTPAGATIWLNTSKVPLKDAEGAVVGLLGTYTDVTARMEMEQELRESQLLYRSFVEQLPMPVFRKDRAGRYVMVNPVFCRLKGLPAEEFLGRTATEVAARQGAGPGPDNLLVKYASEGEKMHAEIMLTGQVVETEEEYTGADGQPTYQHVLRMPVLADDGTVAGMQGIQIDFTSRKLAEARLAEAIRVLQAETEERARAVAQARAAQDEMARLLIEAGRSRQALLSLVEDLRHAEQRLNLEQELAQSTLDALSDHICVVDGTGSIIAVNRAWREFGAANGAPADLRWLGQNYLDICSGAIGPGRAQAAEFSAKLRTVLAGEADSLEMEYPCDSPAERRWFVARATRFTGEGARRAVISHENITARKQAEDDVRRLNTGLEQRVQERTRELQEATMRLEMAQRDAGAGIWGWDIVTGRMDWSPPLFALFGLDQPATGVHPETWDSVVHPEDRAAARAELKKAIRQHERLLNEFRIVRPDGQVRWINTVGQATYDANDQPVRMAGLCIDITVRKQMEEALQQTEERTRTVLEASSIGTFEVDLATGGGKWNSVEFELLGRRPGELPETPESFFRHIHPDDVAPVRAQWEEALRTGEFESEFRVVRADGRECWLAGKGRFARDQAGGRPLRFLGVNYDITARKHLESETTRLLERERQVSEMKTRFISVTSHEFRTPMTTIMGSVELLANHLDRLTPEKRAQIFERVNSSLQRMTTMLDDVLTLNRMDANRTEVRLTPVNFSLFLSNLVHEIRMGDHDAHHFELRLPAGPVPFVTDQNLLHHILSNLLSNAVRYSPADTTVTVGLTSDAWHIHLTVEDQGIGIPPADRARIFEPFERGTNVVNIKGNGLGLNIAKRMTSLLGGSIAHDPLDGGTRFTLTLPHHNPAQPPSLPS
ncbi:MAG: PAS domain-containing protein [Lacunisphaera sp.]|nr:PAS domain-containing protein [Lacunisphaera sp.]